MSSLEAAEMTKLLENTFRAVNIAWINEMADIAGHAGLDVNEIINGAATKPFGFTKFTPGPGIGGHCIPCDPHYLLAGIPKHLTPLTSATMQAVVSRPHVASSKSIEMLGAQSFGPRVPKVILVGVSYKPDIQDVRESPAIEILRELESLGLGVGYYDPLVKTLAVAGKTLSCVSPNDLASADLVIWHTPHSILETNLLLADVKLVLDLTYRLDISDPRIHRLEVSSITNNFSRGRLQSG
jgi:nucleotide sugar dehydrogenase